MEAARSLHLGCGGGREEGRLEEAQPLMEQVRNGGAVRAVVGGGEGLDAGERGVGEGVQKDGALDFQVCCVRAQDMAG